MCAPPTAEAVGVIEDWFEPWVLGDVEKLIRAEANYAGALALMTATEDRFL